MESIEACPCLRRPCGCRTPGRSGAPMDGLLLGLDDPLAADAAEAGDGLFLAAFGTAYGKVGVDGDARFSGGATAPTDVQHEPVRLAARRGGRTRATGPSTRGDDTTIVTKATMIVTTRPGPSSIHSRMRLNGTGPLPWRLSAKRSALAAIRRFLRAFRAGCLWQTPVSLEALVSAVTSLAHPAFRPTSPRAGAPVWFHTAGEPERMIGIPVSAHAAVRSECRQTLSAT